MNRCQSLSCNRVVRVAFLFASGIAGMRAMAEQATLTAAPAASAPADASARWVCVQPHAAFTPRDTAEDAVFRDRMWLSNGWHSDKSDVRDLWTSKDGVTWTLVSDKTPYDIYSEMVVFKGKLWAIKASVWNSGDGEKWEQVSAKTPFGGRGYGELVVFKERMWQLGSGEDIWSTEDGVKWEKVVEHAPYGDRAASAVVVYNDRLWLLAGKIAKANSPPEKGYKDFTTFNDVWSSSDGAKWTRVTEHAPWPARMWSIPAVYAGRLWLIGGYDNAHRHNLGDVWTTQDGKTWSEFKSPAGFAPRHEVTPYVYDGCLWVVAGNTWPVVNDVWRLKLPEGR